MSTFTCITVAGTITPVMGSNAKERSAATSKRNILPLQARVNEVQKLQTLEKTSKNISRRDLTLILTATSLGAATLLSSKPAEARVSKSEMKKKILEKLKILREKAGLSKPESEESQESAPPPPSRAKNGGPPPRPNDSYRKTVAEAATLP